MGDLGRTDEEGQCSLGGKKGDGMGEDGVEAFDGAEGNEVGFGEGGVGGEGFGAGGNYIDIRQCKCAGNFAEEGGFFMIGFDQGEVDMRGPEFEGKGGESGAGADI
jgi:hypothetical protein